IQAQRRYPGLSPGQQFASVTDTVLVQVAPDTELEKAFVGRIEPAVAVAVECDKPFEVRLRALHFVEETDLAHIVDRAVSVAVEDQYSVVGANPSRLVGDTVEVHVEVDGRRCERHQFDAVAVQVEHNRRSAARAVLAEGNIDALASQNPAAAVHEHVKGIVELVVRAPANGRVIPYAP